MEINGIAHVFLTASNFERSREFYRKLLPFLGMKPMIDSDQIYYCVGGRTAVAIRASAPASRSALLTLATGSGQDSAVTGASTGPAYREGSAQRDEPGVVEAFRVDSLDELGRRGRVDRQCHQRLAALLRP